MSHYELIKLAETLGLRVDTCAYYNEALRRKEQQFIFSTPVRTMPSVGCQKGDLIATFKYNPDMEPTEYQDACGTLYNTLKQFEYWR